MSEPCHTDLVECKSPPPRPSSVQLPPLKPGEHHPNQEVVLDEVGEGEMVENKLVIPDEMVHYLSQVADNQTSDGRQIGNWQNSMSQMPFNSMIPATEEMMPSPTNKTNNCVPSPMNSNNVAVPPTPCTFIHSSPMSQIVNSPGTPQINQIMPSPAGNMSQMMPSPAGNMTQMMPSPVGNMTQMMPSPASNINQMMPSPGNMNQIMPSPAANINQMIPSPAANMNQMMPSPAPNINQMMPSPVNNMMPSPAANMNQMMPSPVNNINQMLPSPANNMNQMMPSPAGNMNQLMPTPATNMNQMMPSPQVNLNQMVPSPNPNYNTQMMNSPMTPGSSNQMPPHMLMSPRSQHTQVMSPAQQCMPSPNAQATCPLTRSPVVQMQTNVCMPPNNCSNRQHMSCYGNWNNVQCPKNMCSTRQVHNQQHCQGQVPHNQPPTYNNTNSEAVNHCFQMCNQYNAQNKQYCPHKSRSYNQITCNQQISEPLSSPAVANTAPVEQMGPPQTAQMTRPCVHTGNYDQPQQCYPYNTTHNCSMSKVGCFSNSNNKMCYHQNETMGMEIQCKDISQSQISPGVQQTNTTNMRHDTYQRTLEYVQNCQSWVGHSDMVSSSTHPLKCGQDTSNMIINDMSSSLTSLLEENRYLQMIQ